MSKQRISSEAGWTNYKTAPRGANGRLLCRWCGTEVPTARRTFCSQGCVHKHRLRTQPGYVRSCVSRRDRGVCALCGLDTAWVMQRIRAAERLMHQKSYDFLKSSVRKMICRQLGLPVWRSFWDADHIVAVVEGGGECGLRGYRTLCVPCHKRETAKLAARRAESRNRKGQLAFDMATSGQ